MPEARFSFDADKFNETPVIVVTSLRPRERPHLSVRQRRIAEFCSVEANRRRRKERRGRRKRTTVADRSVSAALTATASHRTRNPYLLDLVMGEHEAKALLQDDVKVLLPARDIFYSDSEVAILSSRPTRFVGNDPPPSIITTRSACLDEKIQPRPCSRIGVIAGTGVEERYLNIPPVGCVLSKDVWGTMGTPYRQVWHSLWEHQVVEGVSSSKTTKPVVINNGPPEQATASASDICSPPIVEKKRRRGVFDPTSTWSTYRSKILNRPWGRPVHQRTPSSGTRSAQRKLSAMRDDHLEGDSESLIDRVPRMRRCEPPRRKQGVPRVVVTTASRPTTAISAEKLDVTSDVHPRSAPENPKPATADHLNTRMARLSTVKPLPRPRFSVPIKASRIPMDLLFREMNCPKPHFSRKDLSAPVGLPVKYRGQHRAADVPFHDLSQDTVFFRDAGQSSLPERSRLATLRGSRRMFNRPTLEASEPNPYSTAFQVDAECMPIPKNFMATDTSQSLSNPHTPLRPQCIDRSMERGPKLGSTNLSVLGHLYRRPGTSRQTSAMYNYSSEADGKTRSGPRFPAPELYQNDVPVSPHYLFEGHAPPNHATQTYHFSHNAPDVLISPPPNPRHRGDTLRVPGVALEIDAAPVTVCNNHYIPTLNFVPRYLGFRSLDAGIDDDRILPEPFLQPNIAPRAFMPSIDFSRTGSPPRPHPEIFPYVRADGLEIFAHAGRQPFVTNFQQAGVQIPFTMAVQDENPSKPLKTLLTFGAQVPSSEQVPSSSHLCGYLSSPRVETESNIFALQDESKSTIPPVVPVQVTKQANEDNLRPGLAATSTNPVVQETGLDTEHHVACPDKPPLSVDINGVKGKDKDTIVSKSEEKERNVMENLNRTNECTDHFRSIKACASLLDCISSENLDMPETSTMFGLSRTRSLHLCTCNHSDTKLSTLTEKSSETQQSDQSRLREVGDLRFDLSSPRGAVAACPPEAEQELRFQLVETKVEGPRESVKDSGAVVIRSKLVDDPVDIQTPAKSSEMLPGDVSVSEMCDDSSALNDTPSERFRPLSDFRSSCTESSTYRVSTSYGYTNGQTSFTESGATCFDGIDDSRVSSLMQSVNSSDIRQRFQSAASHLGARRHIALQCKLAEKCTTESDFSDSKSPVVRKDVCVQVPVLSCRSVETERYTTERGVPDCRAGLTLKLMSTVVDVPPVLKMTETVGISTEDMTHEKDNPATEECESTMPCDVTCSPRDESSHPTYVDRRGPLVNVSTSPRRLRRLKPLFRSHCDEFANICTLAAVPLDAEDVRNPHEKTLSDSSKHRGSCDDGKEQRHFDQRAAFRSAKGQSQAGPSGPLHKDQHSEHHRSAEVHGCFPDKTDRPTVNDRQSRKLKSSPRRTEAPARRHPRSGGSDDKVGSRRKDGEPSKINRLSTGNQDYEDKRKSGCAVCRKEHSHSSQKKGSSKGQKPGDKTADVRSSVVHFGLSSIITPVGNDEPRNDEHRVQISTKNISDDEFLGQPSRSDAECLRSLALEKSKKSEESKSSISSGRKDGRDSVNCESTPVVLVRDSLALNQPPEDDREEVFGNSDVGPSTCVLKQKRTSVTSRSTVPTIFLTRAESNDVPGLEDTSIYAPSVQIAFSSIDSNIKDFSIDSKLKSVLNGVPLKESNSAVDVTVTQPAPPFVETRSGISKDIAEVRPSASEVSNPLDKAVDIVSVGDPPDQMETLVIAHPKSLDEDSINQGVDKQTSLPKLDDGILAESGRNVSLDSESSPESSIGCVFTAMRRYMKSHQRPDTTSETAYWNKCPGFRFAGVPVIRNDSPHKRGYSDCCKCALGNPVASPGIPEEVSAVPQRSSRGSLSSPQKCDMSGDAEDSSNVPKPDKTQKPSAEVNRGSSPTKMLWQNAFQKYQPTSRTAANSKEYSPLQFLHRDSPKTLQDIVSSLKYAKGVCCCESLDKKEEQVAEPIHVLRTLPPDMAASDAFPIRYPRCALALPESSVCARRRSSRSLSAPGEVRISHSRCWSPDHTFIRKTLHDLTRNPNDSHRRTARHRMSSWDDEAFVEDDRFEEDEDRHNVFCYRWGRKDR